MNFYHLLSRHVFSCTSVGVHTRMFRVNMAGRQSNTQRKREEHDDQLYRKKHVNIVRWINFNTNSQRLKNSMLGPTL
jgi:hypothetical protein